LEITALEPLTKMLMSTVADTASYGALVLARGRKRLASVDVQLAGMVMTEGDTILYLGVGAASLGGPMAAFGWLADLAIEQGEPLRREEIVLLEGFGCDGAVRAWQALPPRNRRFRAAYSERGLATSNPRR
jgi:2-keto-4-pentenoate hydratase